MTAPTTHDTTDATEPESRWRRRHPAPPAHPFFRYVFPLLLAGVAVVVLLLWLDGAKAVFDTTEGREIPVVDDPDEEGFLAFATPTPTQLVAHVDANDMLTGVTVLARTSLDDGGSLVVYSPAMLLVFDEREPVILERLYAEEGIEALELAIGEYMGFGFTDEPMVTDTARLAEFLKLVEPIPFSLVDPLVRVGDDGATEVVYEAGFAQFSGAELAEVFEWRNPTERDAGRFIRQLSIWEAWLAQVGEADDLIAATLPFNEGLPPYLRALGTGTAELALVPAEAVDFDEQNPFYALPRGQESWPIDKGRDMVPVPIAWATGAWPTVQLLDGTGDATNRERFLPAVVATSVEITVIGNARSFDLATTYVAYHDVVNEEAARQVAEALGVDVVFEEDVDQPAEVTVTVGADSADVLARLSE